MKKISKTQRRIKFFEMIARLSVYAQSKGISLMPYCFHRSATRQKIYRLRGSSKVKRSFHQDWLAIDFVVVIAGELVWSRSKEYSDLGEAWERMGGLWGGRWKTINDIYHFQEGDWLVHED